MEAFPRTAVGGVSVSRLIIGTNWFLGYSHTSVAKDKFIKEYQTRDRLVEMVTAFVERGVDTIMGPANPFLAEVVKEAEQRTGQKIIQVLTPGFNIQPRKVENPRMFWEWEAEEAFDWCRANGGTICMPHQSVTDALIDMRAGVIRDIDGYTKLIREREMVPGLSCHAPEAVTYADRQDADVDTYIQILNTAGFLMHIETDWVMRIIRDAKKPVMTIKPLAAGRILPPVGLAFVWNAIRDQDMVTIGCTTPDEAKEVIDLSLDFLSRRLPQNELQKTRSKRSLSGGA